MNCHSCVRQLLEGLHSARAPPLSLLLKTCPLFLYTKNYWHSLSQTLRASHNYRLRRLHLRIYANSFRSPSRTVWGDDGNRHLNAFKFLCVCFLVDIGWRYEEHFISSCGTSFWHKPGRMRLRKILLPLLELCDISCGPWWLLSLNNKFFFLCPTVMCVLQTQHIAESSCALWKVSYVHLHQSYIPLHQNTYEGCYRWILSVVWPKCYSGSTGSYIRGFLFAAALYHARDCAVVLLYTGQNYCIVVRFSITAQPRV